MIKPDIEEQRRGRGVGPGVDEEFEAVEPDFGGLLEDRPGRLLALVPLGGGRADHAVGEPVNPLPQLTLLLVEVEPELHASPASVAVLAGNVTAE
jgi:hypothetical protein